MLSFAGPMRTTRVAPLVPFVPNTPTFGHPIISGIGGVGSSRIWARSFECEPSSYSSAHVLFLGEHKLDVAFARFGGKILGPVVLCGHRPGRQKLTACNGGGDTELGVDIMGHLYFNDLTLANFAHRPSDDFGATFT